MKKTAKTKVAKRVSYAGIPKARHALVAQVLNSGAWDMFAGKPKTPQEVWATMQKNWAATAAREEKKKAEDAKESVERYKQMALEDLHPALVRLAVCRDAIRSIEEDLGSMSYIDRQDLAGLVKLGIADAGKRLEQALCNLGLLREDCGYFVDDLKSRGVKMEPEPEGRLVGKMMCNEISRNPSGSAAHFSSLKVRGFSFCPLDEPHAEE